MHRSAATGASLPAWYLTEYAEAYSHAFVRMNDAGFKPVIGAQIEGNLWELARYGLGEKSYLAVCNTTNAARTASLTVFPNEIATGVVTPIAREKFGSEKKFGSLDIQTSKHLNFL